MKDHRRLGWSSMERTCYDLGRKEAFDELIGALDKEAAAQPIGSEFPSGGLCGASRYNVVMWARRFVADFLKVNPAEPDLPPGHTRVDPAEGFGG